MQISLECQTRPETSKPRALRREGLIPATLYGHKGAESVSIMVKAKDAETLLKKASVNNTLVDLNIADLPWNGKALIREVQAHPWKKTLFHLSFFSVATHDKIEVSVPVRLVGEANGVKLGGILELMVSEITVSCPPDLIPEHIDINVAEMEIGDNLHIHQLPLPEGVTCLDEPETTVLSILAPSQTTEEEQV